MPSLNTGFIAVAGGYVHNLALNADGSVVAWGDNSAGQSNVPAPNTGFIAVTGGFRHSMGLKPDGTVVAWGCGDPDFDFGQCSVPAPNTGFIAIAAGATHSLAVQMVGACCDLVSGSCADEVPSFACSGTHQTWTEGAACVDVACDAVTGACCDHDPFGDCTDGVTQAGCDCPTCEWVKLGSCSELDCPHTAIPTVGEWGLVVLTLLLVIGGKLVFRFQGLKPLATVVRPPGEATTH